MVLDVRQFKYRFAVVKVVARHDASIVELAEDVINGGQSNILAEIGQSFINVFSGHVLGIRGLK